MESTVKTKEDIYCRLKQEIFRDKKIDREFTLAKQIIVVEGIFEDLEPQDTGNFILYLLAIVVFKYIESMPQGIMLIAEIVGSVAYFLTVKLNQNICFNLIADFKEK